MTQDLSGRWPWERGLMPEGAPPAPPRPAPQAPMYTLPTVRDRRAENGRRPATARDLVRLKRAREAGPWRYFQW